MKIISVVLLFLFIAQLGWGSEGLFSFLRDHKLGSKVSAGKEGFSELPEIELFGQQFSAYRELDEERLIRSAGIYLRRNTSDVPADELQRVFAEMTTMISSECGEAEMFEVPNFEDATERTHSMRAWKDENSILVLQKFESPGRLEVDVRHVELGHFTSNLGADFGSFVLSKLETKSGELRIPASAPSRRESEANDSPVEQGREVEIEANRESDLAVGVKSGQKESAVENEESDTATWPLILGAIAVLGVAVILVRAFLRGRAS